MMREKLSGPTLGSASDLIVIAPLRGGMTQQYEATTPATRMTATLRTLAAIRRGAREFAPEMFFSDPVERLEQVHSFRIAILPEPPRMLLAVTFDHSWQPYMRALWQDAGPLLDLILTNCEGYPLARDTSLADWSAWVRAHEQPSEYFYSATSLTAGDLGYLVASEQLQRETEPADASDLELADLASVSPRDLARNARDRANAGGRAGDVAAQGLAVLAAMFQLTRVYGADAHEPDALSLLRATLALLDGWTPPAAPPALEQALAWLAQPDPSLAEDPHATADAPDVADVQKGVLTSFDGPDHPMTHGALLFMAITDPVAARRTLAGLRFSSEAEGEVDGLFRTLALTYQGVQRLELGDGVLDALPQEFREGAEARAGQLGDIRSFHPRRWRRPCRWGGGGEIDLAAIDVVLQLRVHAPHSDADEVAGDAAHPLHGAVDAAAHYPGLCLLGVQSLRKAGAVDHLGFVDPIAQPEVTPGRPQPGGDQIGAGELLLGHSVDGRGEPRTVPAFLRNGSFLALRRMQVYPDNFAALLAAAVARTGLDRATLVAKLLGRQAGRGPSTVQGPRQSHVRRANPARGEPDAAAAPRIMRRGMSFGPPLTSRRPGERGILFMAHCASLAEQYELIQRWLNGGNSTRIASTRSDPIVGVPRADDRRVFRFADGGRVHRIDLPTQDRPIVSLDWTLYAFTPSLRAIRSLDADCPAPPALVPEAVQRGRQAIARLRALGPDAGVAWQSVLDDLGAHETGLTRDFWAAVRDDHAGVLASPLGVLVGSRARVLDVLLNRGGLYSVCGYGERFARSVGPIYLGFDADDPRYRDEAPVGNAAIGAIREDDAFRIARDATSDCLRRTLPAAGGQLVNLLIDVIDPVMAELCRRYFGLPDGEAIVAGSLDWRRPDARKPCCPGDLYSPTRYVFEPVPSAAGVAAGQAHGAMLTHTVLALRQGGHAFAGLISDVLAAKAPFADDPALFARTLVGMMTGFAPVTVGNLVNMMHDWVASGALFRVQDAWLRDGVPEDARLRALRAAIADAMRASPAPDTIWRTARDAHLLGDAWVGAGTRVLLSLQSASAEAGGAGDGLDLVFGGRRGAGQPAHACPGYELGMGTLLGFCAALFGEATLRLTGDPRTLELARRA